MLKDKFKFHKCCICGKECPNIGYAKVWSFLLFDMDEIWRKYHFCYDHRHIGQERNNKSIIRFLEKHR